MAKVFDAITPELQSFITEQPMFFVATAADGRVNMSPKGLDSLRILSPLRVVWLNITGSGNETATHLLTHQRMTLMFCSFTDQAKTLRLYGTARTIHEGDSDWDTLRALFPNMAGDRQIFDVTLDLVMTSCGLSVPKMQLLEHRAETTLEPHFARKGREGTRAYQQLKNVTSIDGVPTDLHPRNTLRS